MLGRHCATNPDRPTPSLPSSYGGSPPPPPPPKKGGGPPPPPPPPRTSLSELQPHTHTAGGYSTYQPLTVNMRLSAALLPPLLDLDLDEAFFAGVADDSDQSSAARSLREVFRQAATLGLDGASLGKCLCSYGLGEAAAAAISAAWTAQRSDGGARALVQPPALRLVDMEKVETRNKKPKPLQIHQC